MQRTKEELLSTPQETSTANLLDFTLLKLGNATKQYQRTLKKSQVDTLRDISNKLNEQRNNPDITDAEITEIETEADFILETICNQKAQKMETFRLLHDEKASKAMISLEKKITGYSSMARMNQPNPNYISPESGGSRDEGINPKKKLLIDPAAVRKYMQYFMQEIYKKQHGLTPEEEHVISFLGSDNDDAVLEELTKRRLTDEKRDLLQGPITKDELSTQLKKHMKPNSAPGLDGFKVAWLRHFWDDLADLCVATVNNCYEQEELTRLLKTAIMRLLRKREKLDWKQQISGPSPC